MAHSFGKNGAESATALARLEAEIRPESLASLYEAALAAATEQRGWLAYRLATLRRDAGDLALAAESARTALADPLNPLARSLCHELVAEDAERRGDVRAAERHYVQSHLEDNLRTTAWESLRGLLRRTGNEAEASEMHFAFLGIPESVLARACPGEEGRCLPRVPPPWPVLRFPNARTFSIVAPIGVAPFNYSIEERIRTTTPIDDILVWEFSRPQFLYRNGSMHVIHEGKLVAPLATGDLSDQTLRGFEPKRIQGTVGVLADQFYAPNYAHWLLDAVPRVHLLRAASKEPIDWFYANFAGQPYQRGHLDALGIRPEQLLSAGDLPCIEPDRLLVSMSTMSVHHPAQGAARWAVDFIRQVMLPDLGGAAPTRRIFVSRKDGTTRVIVDEDALFAVLAARFGFERLVLAELSAEEQARAFRDAVVVVAAHGAGNANFVFCSAGTKIFEIFSPLHGTSAFFLIATAVGAEYRCIEGDESLVVPLSTLTRGENPHGARDVTIDAERVCRVLEEAGVGRRT